MTQPPDDGPVMMPEIPGELWTRSAPGAIAVGDLWLLAWDDIIDSAIITAVRADYVLAWPVTFEPEAATGSARLVLSHDSPLGLPMVVWIQAETGIGTHLLARRFGPILSRYEINELRRSLLDGDSPSGTLVTTPAAEPSSNGEDILRRVLQRYQNFCFNEWPGHDVGEGVLNRSAIQGKGIRVEDVTDILGIGPARGLALWDGLAPPTELETTTLANALKTDKRELLVAPTSAEVDELKKPEFKADIMLLERKLGRSEREVRSLLLQSSMQAARQQGGRADTAARINAAIHRLLAE